MKQFSRIISLLLLGTAQLEVMLHDPQPYKCKFQFKMQMITDRSLLRMSTMWELVSSMELIMKLHMCSVMTATQG